MPNPNFTGAQLKIERAKHHLRHLDAEIAAFQGRNPFEIFTETDADTGDKYFRVRVRAEVPPSISTAIGDILHNLRATFDLIAAELVAANGGNRDRAYFPVSYSAESFHDKGRRKVRGAAQDAIDMVERFQPYHAGNEALGKLHKLDILDKHKSIIPVAAAHRHFGLTVNMNVPWQGGLVQFPTINIKPADRQFPLQDGATVLCLRASADKSPDDKYEFAFEVAFGEGHVVDGEPVLPTLAQFGQFTENVLDAFLRHWPA